MTARRLFLSPSQLASFTSCERRWYLETQAGVARDPDAGGLYLAFGRLVDLATELYVADPRAPLHPADLVARVQVDRRGDELTGEALTDERWAELGDRAVRTLRRLAGAGLLPPTDTPSQHRYRSAVPGPDPVTLTGRADFRAPGHVWDVKTTSDRGPGRGRDASTPPRALTAATLRTAIQPNHYAAAEFFADPRLATVTVTWVYASSATQAVWSVSTVFTREDSLGWYEATVRPHVPRLLDLMATEGLDEFAAEANPDACRRCFVQNACRAPYGGPQKTDRVTDRRPDVDIEKLRKRASLVNRPATVSVEQLTDPMLRLQALPPELRSQAEDAALEDALRRSLTHNPSKISNAALTAAVSLQLASLTAEAADVTGGTQDDRRADVVPYADDAVSDGLPADEPVTTSEPSVVEDVGVESPANTSGRPRRSYKAELESAQAELRELRLEVTMLRSDATRPADALRPPTRDDAQRVAVLLAAADALKSAAVAALDAYSAARNQLRAVGVDPDADPSNEEQEPAQ